MPDLLDDLLTRPPLGVDGATIPQAAGVYLFSDGSTALYVGQTRKLRQRMRNHRGATSTHNQASFAFLLAKGDVREDHRDFDLERGRAELIADPVFRPYFDAAKTKVRALTLRFVDIDEPVLRTLFEVYAAVALGTPHNSFETH